MWWYEKRDDMALLSAAIEACEKDWASSDDFADTVSTFVHCQTLTARRSLTVALKNTAQFAVETYIGLRDALAHYYGNSHKWSKNVDERPHRSGRIFTAGKI